MIENPNAFTILGTVRRGQCGDPNQDEGQPKELLYGKRCRT